MGARMHGDGACAESRCVVTAVAAVEFNVLVVPLFVKTPPLAQLAPTQAEPPFAIAQTLVLLAFVWLGRAALRGFRKPGF